MKTVEENLAEEAVDIRKALANLLQSHSSISVRNRNVGGGRTLITAAPYKWLPLGEEGCRLQARILEDYRRVSAIVHALLREQPEKSLRALDESEKILIHIIEQETLPQIQLILCPILPIDFAPVTCRSFDIGQI